MGGGHVRQWQQRPSHLLSGRESNIFSAGLAGLLCVALEPLFVLLCSHSCPAFLFRKGLPCVALGHSNVLVSSHCSPLSRTLLLVWAFSPGPTLQSGMMLQNLPRAALRHLRASPCSHCCSAYSPLSFFCLPLPSSLIVQVFLPPSCLSFFAYVFGPLLVMIL